MVRGIKLFLFFLLAGIVIFHYRQSWAVVPYPVPQTTASAAQPLQGPADKLAGGFKKHEEENIQTFRQIQDELTRIKEQSILMAKEEASWKLTTAGLFLLNFILCIFLGWSLHFKLKNS